MTNLKGDVTIKPATVSVPEAGRILGIGRDSAYEAARIGRLPVLQFGRLKRVPLAALERMLAGDDHQGE